MGYRSALLFRWSRRDRLAVLVVAVTVAFLAGTALLILSAGAQTTAIAAEYGSPGVATHYGSLDAARAAAPSGAAVVPVAAVTLPDGTTGYVVGDPGLGALGTDREVALGPGEGTTLGDIANGRTRRLEGRRGTVTLDVKPRGTSLVPPEWYVTTPATVDRLGPTGAFVIRPGDDPADRGVPLLAALAFFVVGTRGTLSTLAVVAIGGGLLVGVTVYSVTRMSVRDRLPAIRVIRATGATPGDVLGLFALRAALLTGAGAGLGYALGVILPNAAVNLAVYVALPTSLSVRVTVEAVRVLVPLLAGIVAVGGLAGAVAAWSAARRPPARLTGVAARTGGTDRPLGRLRSALGPSVLDWRAFAPTTATLTAFVLFAVLVTSTAGIVAPLASADGATITDPDAPHPFASKVSTAYAGTLESRGIEASPEILLLEVVDGQPFVARGADYAAFVGVTDARIEEGRPPAEGEAAIGVDLARTLGVGVGDRLTLGGSTRPALTRVTVVGTFSAPGAFDDQLLVALPTARHLTRVSSGQVQFVRAARLPDRREGATGIGVVDVDAPERARANGTLPVRVTLRNDGLTEGRANVTVRLGATARRLDVSLPRNARRTETVRLPVGSPGRYTLRVGSVTRPVRVVGPDALVIEDFPERAPPGSEPLVRVVNATGAPAPGVAVSVGNRTVRTDSRGRARIPLDAPGERRIRVDDGNGTASRTVAVVAGAPRELRAELTIRPNAPSPLSRPEARLRLFNPWNATVARSVILATPDGDRRRNVSLAPGGRATVAVRIGQHPPGTYTVRATAEGRTLATATYAVAGDERIAAALASSGRARGTGLSRAIETAFGNVRLVFGVILALAGLMTVGGTTATFAGAVHARRRTIGVFRATGAAPGRLLRIVLTDALAIGAVATVLALGAGSAVLSVLGWAGYLTVFGVRLAPVPSAGVLAGIGLGALVLTLLGAALAAAGLLLDRPVALLGGERADGGPGARRGDPRD